MPRITRRLQAIKKLRETQQLSTAMLKPLGIGFESFLKLAQLSDDRQSEVIRGLVAHYAKEGA